MADWKGRGLVLLGAGCVVAAGVLAWQNGGVDRLVAISAELGPDLKAHQRNEMALVFKNDDRFDAQIVGMGQFC